MNELDDVLAELRVWQQQIVAPSAIEQRLLGAMRAARMKRRRRLIGFAVAATLLICAMLWRVDRPVPKMAQNPVIQVLPVPRVLNPEPVKHSSVRRKKPVLVSSFMALPGTETLPASSQQSIVRVRLAKGELRQYGFDISPPMSDEIVHADLVVGDDGLARAIRLVQ